MKWNYFLVVIFLFFILYIGVVTAETYQQNEEIDLRVPVRIDGGLGSADCNITVVSPSNIILVNFLM